MAVLLAQMGAQRVIALNELMDCAYGAPQTRAFCRQLGHVPLVDPHPSNGEARELAPAQSERFKERTSAERVNSLLKQRYGGRCVQVRGAAKALYHRMVGLVALPATLLFARLC